LYLIRDWTSQKLIYRNKATTKKSPPAAKAEAELLGVATGRAVGVVVGVVVGTAVGAVGSAVGVATGASSASH
jgi:hypothetical protein